MTTVMITKNINLTSLFMVEDFLEAASNVTEILVSYLGFVPMILIER